MLIDLRLFLVEALGYNQAIRDDVDRLYREHRYECYAAAKASDFYSHPLVTNGTLIQEETCRKALGVLLLAAAGREDITDALEAIYRKGWQYAYLYARNHEKVDLEDFVRRAIRKAGGLGAVSDDWLNGQILMAFIFALHMEKEVLENEAYVDLMRVLVARLQLHESDSPMRLSIDHAPDDERAAIAKLRRTIFAHHKHFADYGDLYESILAVSEPLGLLADMDGLGMGLLADGMQISQRDIDETLLAYLARNDGEDMEQAAQFLCAALHVRLLFRAYKAVKEQYFANNIETTYVEMEGLERDLAVARQENAQLQERLKAADVTISTQVREIRRLREELHQEKGNREELNALREFLFSLDRQEEPEVEAPIDPAELAGFRGLVVGGPEPWQARMKRLLPEFTFLSPDLKTVDPRLVAGADAVFVYTQHLNHSLYDRVTESLRGTDVPLAYVDRRNDEHVLRAVVEIARKVRETR